MVKATILQLSLHSVYKSCDNYLKTYQPQKYVSCSKNINFSPNNFIKVKNDGKLLVLDRPGQCTLSFKSWT